MSDDSERSLIRKTVVLHPLLDDYIRRTWALLIEAGHDVTYSVATNFMLLAAVQEAIKADGLAEGTRQIVWDFLDDRETIKRLNLQEHLDRLRNGYAVGS